MFIVYTDVCVPCRYRSQMRILKSIARTAGTTIEIVETRYNPSKYQEAHSKSNLPLPFVYSTDGNWSQELAYIGRMM